MSSDKIVIVVWDGFRPDDISAELTPNLKALAERGTVGTRSHCAYPSFTRVNCASLVTGSWTRGHGLSANTMYVPELEPSGEVSLASAEVVRGLAGLRGGELFGDLPSLASVLAGHGRRLYIASAASPGSSTILGWGGATMVADGLPIPAQLDNVRQTYGEPPGRSAPDPTALNRYMGDVIVDELLPRSELEVLLVWLCEPDAAQHRYGLGDPQVRKAIGVNDEILGRIVEAVGPEGHIIVTSDHGHTGTDAQHASTPDLLDRATGLRHGEAYVLTSDGVHFRRSPSPDDIDRVVRGLHTIDTVGAVFTKDAHPLAMPMAAAHVDGPWAPDVKYSHRAAPGAATVKVGAECAYLSTHGSIEETDMRNLFVAAGPRFRTGHVSSTPCAIVDISATVLELLGLDAPSQWDGRILRETLVSGDARPVVEDASVRATWRHDDGRSMTQTVRRLSVDGTTYVVSGSIEEETGVDDVTRAV